MDNETFKAVITGVSAVLGVAIPIVIILFNRVLKDGDKKIDKLFSLCDEMKNCLLDKAVQLGKIETEIENLKHQAERCEK